MAKLIHNNNEPYVPEPKRNIGVDIVAIIIFFAALLDVLAFLITEKTYLLAIAAISFFISIIIFIVNKPTFKSPKYTPGKVYGDIGERRAGSILEYSLPDDYTVIQNVIVRYNGAKSEIDNIIIGKTGVFIVEVKNMKGKVYADYSEKNWTQDKVDKYGLEHLSLFYNPVSQVGTHIYRLANFLRDEKIFTNISGAVYFANPLTQVYFKGEPKKDIPVFTYNSTDKLLDYILNNEEKLSDKTIKKIIDLLS